MLAGWFLYMPLQQNTLLIRELGVVTCGAGSVLRNCSGGVLELHDRINMEDRQKSSVFCSVSLLELYAVIAWKVSVSIFSLELQNERSYGGSRNVYEF